MLTHQNLTGFYISCLCPGWFIKIYEQYLKNFFLLFLLLLRLLFLLLIMFLSKHCSPFWTLASNSAALHFFQSGHCVPVSYSHYIQIFLNLISSSFPRPFSFLFLPFWQSLLVLTFLRSYFYIVFSQQMPNSFLYVSLSMLFNDSDKLIFGFRVFARCVRWISQRRFGSRCGSHFYWPCVRA